MWQRAWFMLGAGIVAALIAYALFRYRLYHLMKLERLRLRIASDLHDDVGTSVSGMILATQVLERETAQGPASRAGFSELRARAEMTQEALRDIVWLLNPRNDTLDEFFLKLKDTARRQLPDTPCTFKVSGGQSFHRMGLDFKRHVVLFFKEAITNVAKHADASCVDVELAMEERAFSLVIHDNGKGFDPHLETKGNGLKNLRMRAGLIGGSCDITSASGTGTTVSLTAGITYSRTFQSRGKFFS